MPVSRCRRRSGARDEGALKAAGIGIIKWQLFPCEIPSPRSILQPRRDVLQDEPRDVRQVELPRFPKRKPVKIEKFAVGARLRARDGAPLGYEKPGIVAAHAAGRGDGTRQRIEMSRNRRASGCRKRSPAFGKMR